jgi:hypothetical protein
LKSLQCLNTLQAFFVFASCNVESFNDLQLTDYVTTM